MAGVSRRSSFGSSASTSLAKRPAAENAGKIALTLQQQAKKRAALRNLTNQNNVRGNSARPSFPKKGLASNAEGALASRPITTASNHQKNSRAPSLPPNGPTSDLQRRETLAERGNPLVTQASASLPLLVPCTSVVSPSRSAGCSLSMDESISISDSLKSPEIEYLDNVDCIERRRPENSNLSEISDGRKWKMDVLLGIETLDFVDVDDDNSNPLLCASLASDIYHHLRVAETKRRPSTDFMETLQKDINPSMRAILVDWLVEVSEEYRLVPDTLYLTVNYIDRYLSGNEMNRHQLQLLGVACMLIAAKYEEICAPQVEEFCYITDNTYVKEEVLEMEATVLRFLKFEMTSPTVKCFLRRFIRAAQHSDEVSPLHLEFLANYVAELSLLEYSFLCYSPSLIAASAIFLAKFILSPSKRPWNATLRHYTQYGPSDLCVCAKDLHRLVNGGGSAGLPAIRDKYSQHKYKFVAKKYCPATIPAEFFQDARP
ncbi:cyclin A1;1 [Wolffia australiana]